MDPISAALGLAGLGMQAYGTFQGVKAAKQSSAISGNIAGLEQQANEQRHNLMVQKARREQLEMMRQNQRQRMLALNTATNQGAQFGSGLAGGLAQVQDQSNTNLLGNFQALGIGNNLFGIDNQISQQKQLMAQTQSSAATAQGWSSFGADLTKSAGTISNLASLGKPAATGGYQTYGQFVQNLGMGAII